MGDIQPGNHREREIKAQAERRLLRALLLAIHEFDVDQLRVINRVCSIYLEPEPDQHPAAWTTAMAQKLDDNA